MVIQPTTSKNNQIEWECLCLWQQTIIYTHYYHYLMFCRQVQFTHHEDVISQLGNFLVFLNFFFFSHQEIFSEGLEAKIKGFWDLATEAYLEWWLRMSEVKIEDWSLFKVKNEDWSLFKVKIEGSWKCYRKPPLDADCPVPTNICCPRLVLSEKNKIWIK